MGLAAAVIVGAILDLLLGWAHPIGALIAGAAAGWVAGAPWRGLKAGILSGVVGGALVSIALVAGLSALAGPAGLLAGLLASPAIWWVFLIIAALNGAGGLLGGLIARLAHRVGAA
ncbi:MAG: hypothetical protein LRS49_00565 [Desulfurococcales archaeon]|nr:hypothetical protein [Desulfurococcales archaeon]